MQRRSGGNGTHQGQSKQAVFAEKSRIFGTLMIETNDPAVWRNFLPWPGAETHKHARGRLGVVSGRAHQTGAARLAARAGLRIGAGVVRILCPPDAVVATAIDEMLPPASMLLFWE